MEAMLQHTVEHVGTTQDSLDSARYKEVQKTLHPSSSIQNLKAATAIQVAGTNTNFASSRNVLKQVTTVKPNVEEARSKNRSASGLGSKESVSHQAVNKIPISGLCVDLKKTSQMMSLMPRICRQENKVDLLLQFTTELQKVCGLAQATVFLLHPSFKRIYSSGIRKDQ